MALALPQHSTALRTHTCPSCHKMHSKSGAFGKKISAVILATPEQSKRAGRKQAHYHYQIYDGSTELYSLQNRCTASQTQATEIPKIAALPLGPWNKLKHEPSPSFSHNKVVLQPGLPFVVSCITGRPRGPWHTPALPFTLTTKVSGAASQGG